MKTLFAVILLSIPLVLCIRAQSDWDTYAPRGISALIEQEQRLVNNSPKSDLVISAQPFPAKTVVTYSGSKRPIDELTKFFIKMWAQSRNLPAENANMLAEEGLFKEKEREYWIPILRSIAPYVEKELKPGDEIEIYYFYLGGFNPKGLREKDKSFALSPSNEKDTIRWIFAVEEFKKSPPSAFTSQPLDKAIDRSMETKGKILDIWFDARQVKSKTRLTFTGDIRPVSESRKPLLEIWFEKNGFPEGASSLMRNEARFLDGDKEYWIAVRNTTLDAIIKNVTKGDSILLNTILAGGIRSADQIDWFFLAGEYMP